MLFLTDVFVLVFNPSLLFLGCSVIGCWALFFFFLGVPFVFPSLSSKQFNPKTGLPGIDAVTVTYSKSGATSPCIVEGQNITIRFGSAANLMNVQPIVLQQWSVSANETSSLKQKQSKEIQTIQCRATSGSMQFYFGSQGPVEIGEFEFDTTFGKKDLVNSLRDFTGLFSFFFCFSFFQDATALPSSLKNIFEQKFHNINEISVQSSAATLCNDLSPLGAETNITFISTKYHGNQPPLQISTMGGQGANGVALAPLLLTPPTTGTTGRSCVKIDIEQDYGGTHSVERQQTTCRFTQQQQEDQPTFATFIKGGSSAYDYTETMKATTLTLSRNGSSSSR